MRFQSVLGLVVLGAVGLFAWGQLGGLGPETRPARAGSESRELARAIVDYRRDTGYWPRNEDGAPDLKPLLGSGHGTIRQAAGTGHAPVPGQGFAGSRGPRRQWLREIPLDPWGNPYRVLLGDRAVAVLSCGPDRVLDTDPDRLWIRPANINPGDGDDVGFVLELEKDGESR